MSVLIERATVSRFVVRTYIAVDTGLSWLDPIIPGVTITVNFDGVVMNSAMTPDPGVGSVYMFRDASAAALALSEYIRTHAGNVVDAFMIAYDGAANMVCASVAFDDIVPVVAVTTARAIVLLPPPDDGRVTLPPSLSDNVVPLNDKVCAGAVIELPPEIDIVLPLSDRV